MSAYPSSFGWKLSSESRLRCEKRSDVSTIVDVRVGREAIELHGVPLVHEHAQQTPVRRAHERVVESDDEDARLRIRRADFLHDPIERVERRPHHFLRVLPRRATYPPSAPPHRSLPPIEMMITFDCAISVCTLRLSSCASRSFVPAPFDREIDGRLHRHVRLLQLVDETSADAEARVVARAARERVAEDERDDLRDRRVRANRSRYRCDRLPDVAAEERVESGAEHGGRDQRGGERQVPEEEAAHPLRVYERIDPLSPRDLTKVIGKKTIVDGVSLDIPAGEVFGFLGPNGAGKTTTIRMLVGLIKPTAGTRHDLRLRPAPRLRAGDALHRLHRREARPLSLHDRPREPRALRADARRRARARSSASPRWSASRIASTSASAPTPSACASASASRRRSSAIRSC